MDIRERAAMAAALEGREDNMNYQITEAGRHYVSSEEFALVVAEIGHQRAWEPQCYIIFGALVLTGHDAESALAWIDRPLSVVDCAGLGLFINSHAEEIDGYLAVALARLSADGPVQ